MIKQLMSEVPVSFLCEHFAVSRSGFYNWLCEPDAESRQAKKIKFCEQIKSAFKMSKSSYGAPRIWQELDKALSLNTVAKYMRELGLNARLKKKFRVMTTDSNHDEPIADRVFKYEEKLLPSAPSEIFAGDITYLKLGSSHLYLAIVMDLFNREIVG